MSVLTDPYKLRLFNDGQALIPGDVNDVQRFADARLLDQLVSRLRGGHLDQVTANGLDPEIGTTEAEGTIIAATEIIWALSGGEALVVPTTDALKIAVMTGTVYQKQTGAPDGSQSKLLPFTITGSPTLTLGAGHATLGRIDLIEMKIEEIDTATTTMRSFQNATTRVVTDQAMPVSRYRQATIQVKAGTAASNPQYPSPTSGFGVLGAVYVPATHSAVFTRDHMRMLTVPLGVRHHVVHPFNFDRGAGTDWTVAGALGTQLASAGSPPAAGIFIYPPEGHQSARLLGVGLLGNFSTGATVYLLRIRRGVSPTSKVICDLTSQLAGSGNVYRYANMYRLMEETDVGDDVELPGLRNAGIGDPIWLNGRKSGPAQRFITQDDPADHFDSLALYAIGDTATTLTMVTWVTASGL